MQYNLLKDNFEHSASEDFDAVCSFPDSVQIESLGEGRTMVVITKGVIVSRSVIEGGGISHEVEESPQETYTTGSHKD